MHRSSRGTAARWRTDNGGAARLLRLQLRLLITATTMASMSKELSGWYFSEKGGLMLTTRNRDLYFALQRLLHAVGTEARVAGRADRRTEGRVSGGGRAGTPEPRRGASAQRAPREGEGLGVADKRSREAGFRLGHEGSWRARRPVGRARGRGTLRCAAADRQHAADRAGERRRESPTLTCTPTRAKAISARRRHEQDQSAAERDERAHYSASSAYGRGSSRSTRPGSKARPEGSGYAIWQSRYSSARSASSTKRMAWSRAENRYGRRRTGPRAPTRSGAPRPRRSAQRARRLQAAQDHQRPVVLERAVDEDLVELGRLGRNAQRAPALCAACATVALSAKPSKRLTTLPGRRKTSTDGSEIGPTSRSSERA